MGLDFTKFTSAVSGSMTTAKAALFFFSSNEESVEMSDSGSNAAGALSSPGIDTTAFADAAGICGRTKQQLQKVEDKVKAAAEKVHDLDKMAVPRQVTDIRNPDRINDSTKVSFQFNPATLRISASGGGMVPVTSYGSKEGDKEGDEERRGYSQVDYGPIEENVTVGFKVIFDAVKNTDAFLCDKWNLGPTNLTKHGVDIGRGAVYTVRPVVEGFLASVRNRGSRRVVFQWGSMRYGGFLNKVQCRYTMFNTVGEPVRAEIDLSLTGSAHNDYNNVREWEKRYEAFMEEATGGGECKGSFVNVGSAVTGGVEKAYILFHDKARDPQMEGGTVKGKTILKAPVFQQLSDMTWKISNAANAVTGAAGDLSDLTGTANKAGYVPVKIQYNPSAITMYSRSGEIIDRYNNSAGTPGSTQYQRNAIPMETVLSMELIFDDTVNSNAFMLDAGTGSPTGMVRAGDSLINQIKGREYSVAPISELFVAAAASAYSRMVCVVWNKMAFWGELYEVDVEYTMFNNKGNPVRSKVSIRVRQDGEADKDGISEKAWQEAYKNLQKETQKLTANKSLTNSSGNFLSSNLLSR